MRKGHTQEMDIGNIKVIVKSKFDCGKFYVSKVSEHLSFSGFDIKKLKFIIVFDLNLP